MQITTKIFFLSLLGAFFLSSASAQNSFLPELEDIPLMPGLAVVSQGEVFFPTPVGRIATVRAIGTMDWEIVIDFYQKTLPSLGWAMLNPTLYTRDNEQLEISSQSDSQGSYVVFSVSPLTR